MNVLANLQAPLLELDLLKTLVAISDTGNFSAAANAVHRTPSAVSMQVKRMEEILGRPVFDRDSRSVTLTTDGEVLLQHARRVLALNRQIMAQFVKPEVSGEVRLGTVDHMAEQFLPGVLKRFGETHPGITVDVIVEHSKDLAERIRKNQLDLAIVTCSATDYSGLDVEAMHKEQLVWAGVKGGVAAEQQPLPVSVWEPGCVWREAAIAGLEKQNRDYRVTFKSSHTAGQKSAIVADLAIAPLPISACEGDIVVLGEEYGLPDLNEYTVGVIKTEKGSAPVDAFIDHLRASFAQL